MERRRIARAGIVISVAALALSGCAFIGSMHADSREAAPAAKAGGHASSAAPNPQVPTLNGVIATGPLVSTDGRTNGTVVLTAANGVVTASIDGFATASTGQLDLHLSPYAPGVTCPADSWSFVMNGVTGSAATWSLPIDVNDGAFDVDPTYLRTAVLRADADAGKPNTDDCVYPVLAVAKLDWRTAPTHTGFAVTDHGRRSGANGSVTEAQGQLSTYTVAPDDHMRAICDRFGLTAADLLYLNPFTGATADSELTYGTVFNLLPANRGAPPD